MPPQSEARQALDALLDTVKAGMRSHATSLQNLTAEVKANTIDVNILAERSNSDSPVQLEIRDHLAALRALKEQEALDREQAREEERRNREGRKAVGEILRTVVTNPVILGVFGSVLSVVGMVLALWLAVRLGVDPAQVLPGATSTPPTPQIAETPDAED